MAYAIPLLPSPMFRRAQHAGELTYGRILSRFITLSSRSYHRAGCCWLLEVLRSRAWRARRFQQHFCYKVSASFGPPSSSPARVPSWHYPRQTATPDAGGSPAIRWRLTPAALPCPAGEAHAQSRGAIQAASAIPHRPRGAAERPFRQARLPAIEDVDDGNRASTATCGRIFARFLP